MRCVSSRTACYLQHHSHSMVLPTGDHNCKWGAPGIYIQPEPQVPHVRTTGATAVSLSPASEPFPAKLVERIRSGQFVDMREQMTDNIALLQQLETSQCPISNLPEIYTPRLREILSLPSWLHSFLAYVAIRSDDTRTRNMLAYVSHFSQFSWCIGEFVILYVSCLSKTCTDGFKTFET